MRSVVILECVLLCVGGCSTSSAVPVQKLRTLNTNALCQAWVNNPDPLYKMEVAKVLVTRGASPEKFYRLVASDQAIMTGIAIAAAGAAVGVAAANDGYGGYHPQPGLYGVAWDRFSNNQWRCRDRGTGQFVDDYRCAGLAMHDATWPG